MDENYTVSLERVDNLFLSIAILPNCFSCRKPLTVEDKVYVKVKVPEQAPLRFHDGYCMQHFTLGMYAFLENRAQMIEKGVYQ